MRHARSVACALLVLLAAAAPAAPEGRMTWGAHVSLAPTWFDPAETQGIITPFMIMYAIHDAMAKAMPGNPTAPSLAFINGHGPRVQESGLGLIPGHAYSAPYEDVKLEGK